jgi:hypothetical protein
MKIHVPLTHKINQFQPRKHTRSKRWVMAEMTELTEPKLIKDSHIGIKDTHNVNDQPTNRGPPF